MAKVIICQGLPASGNLIPYTGNSGLICLYLILLINKNFVVWNMNIFALNVEESKNLSPS